MNARLAAIMTVVVVTVLLISPLAAQDQAPTAGAKIELKYRWVYVQTNLLVDKNVEDVLAVCRRAAVAGYNGIVLCDSKFMRWDNLPPKYLQNVQKVAQACRDLKLGLFPGVCPMGYSEDLLSRDPNLAEGLQVKDAPFVVRGGKLVPADESIALPNADFEQHTSDKPAGWKWTDEPGKITFIDTQVFQHGTASLRMEPQGGNCRAMQTLAVEPYRQYHVWVWVRTQDFGAAAETRIQVLTRDGASLNYGMPAPARTQDWKRVDVTFNSGQYREVNLYFGIWGGRGGKIWWDNAGIEPAGLMNVVRRDGAPLAVASEDGKTQYVEGKDFAAARDPLMGMTPWAGGYTAWHKQPEVAIPDGSRLKEGQQVRVSYYHASIIQGDQVGCCMSEPKVYEIIDWQIQQVKKAMSPDGYFMSHDEIRQQGTDFACRQSKLTPGQILAENVKRCTEIIRKHDDKPIFVWSDMFDPTHNAKKTGRYYLVEGDGPWYESWKGLPREVIVVNWQSNPRTRPDSLRHFEGLGNRQILAGYYDHDVTAITSWLADAAKVKGVEGVMYTTWRHDYSDLEKFAAEVGKSAAWPAGEADRVAPSK